jgi:L-seryl-tRNA(Ser) seleniumtransferase
LAILPPDILKRLPSASELLEKPPVRALADRWNRSTVASSVRSFLDEFANDLRRRAANVELPSIRELAERAARYVVSQQQQSSGAAINATGQFWAEPWTSIPLADPALERVVAAGREFTADASEDHMAAAELETQLVRRAGAEAAVVLHSYPAAIWLTLAALAAEREALIARTDVGDVDRGNPLPALATAANCRLRDVGTLNHTQASDYESAISLQTGVILKLSTHNYRVVGQSTAAEDDALVALARDREIPFVAAMGIAPLADLTSPLPSPPQSVRAAIAAGVDLVVLRGDGYVGGPPCGVIVGRRDLVERISRHPLFASMQLDPLRRAALLATVISASDSPERTAETPPVRQLLTAPIENLRNRAERIAPQLAAAAEIASAVAVETRSSISAAESAAGACPSYAVALTPRERSIAELDKRLQSLTPPVIGRVESDRILLDLRTVLARQDRALVEAICGTPSTDQTQPAGAESNPQ